MTVSKHRGWAGWLLGVAFAGGGGQAGAAGDCSPLAHAAQADGERIAEVEVVVGNVFDSSDPLENRLVHRIANALHVKTRERVVRQQLLFGAGDIWSSKLGNDSERLLRSQPALADARVSAIARCAEGLLVHVRTRDTWSTVPSLSLSRVAGRTERKVSLEEHNLFGTGRAVHVSIQDKLDRKGRTLRYRDRMLAGGRRDLLLEYQDNDDGQRRALEIAQPFRRLEDPIAWEFAWFGLRDQIERYDDETLTDRLDRRQRRLDTAFWVAGPIDERERAWRSGVGLRLEDTAFSQLEGQFSGRDRSAQLLWFGLSRVQSNYLTTRRIHRLGVTEDLPLGRRFTVQLGFDVGARSNLLWLSARGNGGWQSPDGALLSNRYWLDTRIDEELLRGTSLGTEYEYVRPFGERHRLYLHGRWEVLVHPDVDQQLSLGGDTGLRGFGLHARTGDRLALVNVEWRRFFDWQPWRLMQFAGVAFADVGSAWRESQARSNPLWDLGVGLRLSSNRSSSGRVMHFDFALPEGRFPPQVTATTQLKF